MDAFTNREIATIIWIGIILFWVIRKKPSVAKAFKGVIDTMMHPKLISLFVATTIYVLAEVFLLKKLGLWNIRLLKDTLYWFLGAALILETNLITSSQKHNPFFKKVVKENLSLIVILEFVLNFYTFHLLIELIILPTITLIFILAAFTKNKPKYNLVNKILGYILIYIGFLLILFVITKIAINYNELATSENLKLITLTPLLTLGFLPFLYSIALISKYELIFVRLNLFIKDDKLKQFIKIKILQTCHINLKKVTLFNKEMPRYLSKIKDRHDTTKS
jgi:hypothetical protein